MSVDADDLVRSLFQLALGAIGGGISAFVAMRTRLALMERDIKDERTARTVLEQHIDDRFEILERRSIAQLRLTANIARKLQVDARFDDALVRMLGEES